MPVHKTIQRILMSYHRSWARVGATLLLVSLTVALLACGGDSYSGTWSGPNGKQGLTFRIGLYRA
jgi:hypothetical protein